MGLGKPLTFKVDGIPSKLAHYVVDKFKASKMEIRTPSGDIKMLYVDSAECRKMKVDYTLNQITFWTMDRLRIRERLEIKGRGFGKVKPVWPQYNSVEETNSKISDVLEKINEEIVDEEIHGVNENEMEDNNIEKLDITVDLESDDNIDVNQVFQNETIEKDEEAKEMDMDQGKEMLYNDEQNKNMFVEVGKVKKIIVDVEQQKKEGRWMRKVKSVTILKMHQVIAWVDIQKEVEEIHQLTDKETNVHAWERDVDPVELRKTVVDANNEATNEEGMKNVEDNDGPSYSLGLTQDGLILTADGEINTGQRIFMKKI
ncbi:hypothetical protein L1987_45660 [Smallanthus sonchifolius]|uniref:Uncharacterized protein n=1 Tax=Smallanthus sonchifolius TaxID=185202 RepID=A0ACB9FZA2_9ASTR|nr:hypothetical protein L1987_45660 [Smallanthus sonchifolius]